MTKASQREKDKLISAQSRALAKANEDLRVKSKRIDSVLLHLSSLNSLRKRAIALGSRRDAATGTSLRACLAVLDDDVPMAGSDRPVVNAEGRERNANSDLPWVSRVLFGETLTNLSRFLSIDQLAILWVASTGLRDNLTLCPPPDMGMLSLWHRKHLFEDVDSVMKVLRQPRWKGFKKLVWPKMLWRTKSFKICHFLELPLLCPTLVELDLVAYNGASWGCVAKRVLAFASAFPNLQVLKIVPEVAYQTLVAPLPEYVCTLPALRTLHLVRNVHHSWREWLPALRNLRDLHELRLRNCCLGFAYDYLRPRPQVHHMDRDLFADFLSSCPNLVTLDIEAWSMSREAIVDLLVCPQLRFLSLHATGEEQMRSIDGLARVVSLRHLKLATKFPAPAWIQDCAVRFQAARSDVTVLVDRPSVV